MSQIAYNCRPSRRQGWQICDLRDSWLIPVVHILIFSTRSVKCVGCFSPTGLTVRTLRAVWRKILFFMPVLNCLIHFRNAIQAHYLSKVFLKCYREKKKLKIIKNRKKFLALPIKDTSYILRNSWNAVHFLPIYAFFSYYFELFIYVCIYIYIYKTFLYK